MIAIDTHTHIYSDVHQREMLVAGGARLLAASSDVDCAVLFLCEPSGRNLFGNLRRSVDEGKRTSVCDGWQFKATEESCSIMMLGPNTAGAVIVIRGQQIVTSENLEVLGIGHQGTVPDGQTLKETIDGCRTSGAHVILPWGAGKWLGSRGQLINEVIERASFPEFYIGDNGGRPAAWAVSQFRLAASSNIKILNGSDPLPIPGDESRIGTYASVLDVRLDMATPWNSISSALRNSEDVPLTIGQPMRVLSFLRSQFLLRMQNIKRPKLIDKP